MAIKRVDWIGLYYSLPVGTIMVLISLYAWIWSVRNSKFRWV